jgi:hypothetical protein
LAFEIDTVASLPTHPAGLGLCPGAIDRKARRRALQITFRKECFALWKKYLSQE